MTRKLFSSAGLTSAVLLVTVFFWQSPTSTGEAVLKADQPTRIQGRDTKQQYKDSVEIAKIRGLKWTGDLRLGLSQSSKEKKLVLVEFTAGTNVDGQLNHRAILPQPAVRNALKPYRLVMLYVDVVPGRFFKETLSDKELRAEAEANYEFEKKAFGTAQLPFYAIIKPIGKGQFEIVARYAENRIESEEMFVKFLRGPMRPPK